MGVIITTTAGLVVWVILWGMGVKGFDAFMITLTMIVIAAMGRVVATSRSADDR